MSAAWGVSYRWSAGSYRIYVTGPGTVTLSDVRAGMPNAPLAQVAPAVWHLRANLVMENGARLLLHGTKIGGDVNQLRLQSNNTGESNAFVHVTADWGSIDIRSTSITSWDDAVNGPDTESGPLRRAFIRVRSSLAPDGVTPRESRMDVIDSDIGYLGSHDAEAYGLVWKVIESPNSTYGSVTNLYNLVNVYGDIIHSRLHHNYFGMYSYGAYGMRMINNEADHNVGYGLDPHDDSDYLVIEGNNVHHNGLHGIIASQRCNNIIIRNNISWNNALNGIMLHRYCDDSLIENNRSLHNGDSGVALFDNRRTIVRGNTCLRNFNAGIRLSVGAQDNLIENNEFGDGGNYGLYLYKGGDLPFPGDDGHPKRNRFVNNYIHHNAGNPVFLTDGDDNSFVGNIFEGSAGPLRFINGARNRMESNALPREIFVNTQGMPDFLSSTIVRNQGAISIQVDGFSSAIFEGSNGRIFDPEEPGIATTAAPAGSTLTLTTVQIAKTSFVQMRNLQATPDVGTARVTVTVWNVPPTLSKGWLTQASSSTRRITYRVGDLTPGGGYQITRNGVASSYTADSTGTITFQDTSVTTAATTFDVRP
ncbi:MAG TPA: right-handed parallel beta-helix repeat-containing protein [Methylomirabilota bacterium]|nr:right-handed parallel beta-helix repeat-containing protein [Methylomirabilota bacterium]